MKKPFIIFISLMLFTVIIASHKNQMSTNLFIEGAVPDLNLMTNEITYVNWVNEITKANIYIRINTLANGSNGIEYTIIFNGLHEFTGLNDTLSYYSPPQNTDDAKRRGIIQIVKLGLMRYLARTEQAGTLKIQYTKPTNNHIKQNNWNYWAFTISPSAQFIGQKQNKNYNYSTYLSANRITEDWKFKSSYSLSYSENCYDYDNLAFTSISRKNQLTLFVAKSMGEHFSIGKEIQAFSSTYDNLKFQAIFSPAIEYSFFPYQEATTRVLIARYEINYGYQDYIETTIYFKNHENLFSQSLYTGLELIEKWGSSLFSITYSNYLHDLSKKRLRFNAYLTMRLIKGLSFNFNCTYSIIHDQLFLSACGATPEQVLLKRKELNTRYSYMIMFGFSYSFGNIYQNIINTRFD